MSTNPKRPSQSSPSLLVHTPDGAERQYLLLGVSAIIIGRDRQCDIVLEDEAASRQHAQIRLHPDGSTVEDLGSVNGTLCNGAKLKEGSSPLHDGDLLKIGRSEIRYLEGEVGESKPVMTLPLDAEDLAMTALMTGTFGHEVLAGNSPLLTSPAAEAGLLRVVVAPHDVPLLVVKDGDAIHEVKLGQAPLVIGRTPEVDVYLTDKFASRKHAEIRPVEDGFVLRDLGARHGLFVNGIQVRERTLIEGDVIRIGSSEMVFKDGRSPVRARPKQPRRPLVVIPGFIGSELYRGETLLWPNLRRMVRCPKSQIQEYWEDAEVRGMIRQLAVIPGLIKAESFGSLTNFLTQDLGYESGKDLLEFPYDWRSDNRKTARLLARAIRQWRQQLDRPADRITLIAHSMGGLVARLYLQHHGGAEAVEQVIFLGTPHKGSANSLLFLLTGRTELRLGGPGALRLSMKLRRVREIVQGFASAYQLLPTEDTVFFEDGSAFRPMDDAAWVEPVHLPHFEAAQAFCKDLLADGHTPVTPATCIYGYGRKTVGALRVRRERSGALSVVEINHSDGDATVLQQSAVLDKSGIHPVKQEHGVLHSDPDVQRRLAFELMERPL